MQARLSVWLTSVILLIASAAGVFSFFSAFEEANEMQDEQLIQIAGLVNRQLLPPASAPAVAKQTDVAKEAQFVVQPLPQLGSAGASATTGASMFPADLADGLQTVLVGSDEWRVFVRTIDAGPRVAVAQPTAVRDENAGDGALRTVLPFVVLIPVLLLLVADLIRREFNPLKKLATEIDLRSELDLQAVSDAGLPTEVRPFVVAINRLLSRVSDSAALHRRFIADAAHELRSPLTALSLQAERLDAAYMPPEAKERLGIMRQGLQRTRALLDQLLTFARLQEIHKPGNATASMLKVFQEVVEDLMPLAEHKQIDLGVVGEEDAVIAADAMELRTLVKNLVENAIHYTPHNGRVDLTLRTTSTHVILQVDDTGPGIPETERHRVFDPFYRVLGNDEDGSGLGLSIVKTIANRYGADIDLDSAASGTGIGLRVTITFPRA